MGYDRILPSRNTSGARASDTRSLFWMPNVFDIASTTTKYSSTNTSDAMVTEVSPQVSWARSATRMADPFCTIITVR